MDDLLGIIHQNSLAAVSGSDGQLLWGPDSTGFDPTVDGVGDLSGDGVADVLLSDTAEGAISARSGKDGRTLWTSTNIVHAPAGQYSPPIRPTTFLHSDDLNGDGQQEVVVGYSHKKVPRSGVAVFAGRTGTLIWKKEWSHTLRNAMYLDGLHDVTFRKCIR